MDALDEKVLQCLVRDARATFAEIGAEVGLSAPAVKRRVDRLVASGAVRGFTAVVDPAALGWTTEAYVEVRCQGPVAPAELRRRLTGIPEVVEAVTVTGRADALLHLLARDVRHLERALERVRDELDLDSSESAVVLSRLLDRARTGPEGGG
ncbi:Lrp/AsnC family transcriptional regulator [Pseudokineococcus sp. 1T1Z-3]|uniref:Lrp/AsnC family transcriptional regulator n=1 Tax=Pseudokineococcus sp. 1T1Z-3 TaxID=3132745 RepID=UPI0030B52EFE